VIPGFLEKLFVDLFRFIDGEKVRPGVFQYFAWILWPLAIGYALRKLPSFPRRYAVFLLLTGSVLPYGETLIDGCLCLQTTFGYFVASKWMYDVASQVIGFYFLNGIVAGSVGALSIFAFRAPKLTVLHLLVSFVLFFVAIVKWERVGRDTTVNWTIWRVSLGFHILPLITLFNYMTLRRVSQGKRDSIKRE
jgi:hypothetical protein